jgi:hypothetical protein
MDFQISDYLEVGGISSCPFLQEANPAENLRAQRGYFEGEFGKGGVPHGVIRKQQTAGGKMWISSAELPKHMLIGVETVVNKDIRRTNLVKKSR